MFKISIILSVLAILFLALLYPTGNSNLAQKYTSWKQDFGVKIHQTQDSYRQLIFFKNYQQIEEHNSQQHSYSLGINQFAHLTQEQFQALYANMVYSGKSSSIQEKQELNALGDIDWEKLGKVSPVRNEGTCDSGYAFCTTSLFQSYLLFKKQNTTLSAQQLVDCGGDKYTIFGCNGGSRSGAINFTLDNGLQNEKDYSYTGKKGSCKTQSGSNKFSLNISIANGCTEMRNLLNTAPMTTAVNIQNWQFYRAGVFNNCGQTVSHDIYLVGATIDYWRLKNSWGVRWGQFGYIRLTFGDTCGICSKAGFSFIP